MSQAEMVFSGPAGPEYKHDRDSTRLTRQLARVYSVMSDAKWRTLRRIADLTGDPEASVSAQLRHLRKERFGSHTVNRRHLGDGLFEYQLIVCSSLSTQG